MTHYGQTEVIVCDDEFELGRRAAEAVAGRMRELLRSQDEISMVLAAGESQNEFLSALSQERDLEWQRVVCFNMDDFWDVRMPERFTCGYQTRTQLYDKVKPRQFHLVRFNAPDPEAEAKRFGGLIAHAGAIDILCQGIGTSGHLALNEPGATDFRDPELVRVVDLAEQSKRQLRDDPNFRDLGYIPQKGITMTIPALLAARHIFTMTPLALKREIFDAHDGNHPLDGRAAGDDPLSDSGHLVCRPQLVPGEPACRTVLTEDLFSVCEWQRQRLVALDLARWAAGR